MLIESKKFVDFIKNKRNKFSAYEKMFFFYLISTQDFNRVQKLMKVYTPTLWADRYIPDTNEYGKGYPVEAFLMLALIMEHCANARLRNDIIEYRNLQSAAQFTSYSRNVIAIAMEIKSGNKKSIKNLFLDMYVKITFFSFR